jgi:hypothetical protein
VTAPRPEIARMSKRLSGYYGLRRLLIIRGVPDPVWRVYWALQPVRCLFGWHDWYSTAAGECSACLCGASGAWPTWIAHEYRWTPWLRKWVVRVEEAENAARVWQDAYLEPFREVRP